MALFLFISFILNVANISTVASHNGLRSSGYFHLVALFSAFNVVFYTVELLLLALVTLKKFDILPNIIHQLGSGWIKQLFRHVVHAQLTLQLLQSDFRVTSE